MNKTTKALKLAKEALAGGLWDYGPGQDEHTKCEEVLAVIREALAEPVKQEPTHPDDEAVDRFAAAMKVKLAKKRAEGRGGWEDKERCSAEFLNHLLNEHVGKGDPVDVGNLAMMLWNRGERTIAEPVKQEPVAYLDNGTRFKVTLTDRDCYIKSLPRELGGKWVALVAAEDDCHLKAAPVQPVLEPAELTDDEFLAKVGYQHRYAGSF